MANKYSAGAARYSEIEELQDEFKSHLKMNNDPEGLRLLSRLNAAWARYTAEYSGDVKRLPLAGTFAGLMSGLGGNFKEHTAWGRESLSLAMTGAERVYEAASEGNCSDAYVMLLDAAEKFATYEAHLASGGNQAPQHKKMAQAREMAFGTFDRYCVRND